MLCKSHGVVPAADPVSWLVREWHRAPTIIEEGRIYPPGCLLNVGCASASLRSNAC